jgi:hypothetical protein
MARRKKRKPAKKREAKRSVDVDILATGKLEEELPPPGSMEGVFKRGQKVKIHPAAKQIVAATGVIDPEATFTIISIIPREQNKRADAEAAALGGTPYGNFVLEVDMLLPAGLPNPINSKRPTSRRPGSIDPTPYIEDWRFRVETDVDVFGVDKEGHKTKGWYRTFSWRKHGIFVLKVCLYRSSAMYADMEGELVLAAADPDAMRRGMNALVDAIREQPGTHVLVESLKPVGMYDGERDGPFTEGGRLEANPAVVPIGSSVYVNMGKRGYARVIGHPAPGKLRVRHLFDGKERTVRTQDVSVIEGPPS